MPSTERKQVTISDVAYAAGVSTGTVSKVMNNRGQLRPETRKAVLDAARQLGFVANGLARGIRSGRSYTVGVISDDSFGRFSLPIMLGAEDTLSLGQMSLFLCDTRDDYVRERSYVENLTARQVDGFLVTSRLSRSRPPLQLSRPLPVVYVRARSEDPSDTSIVSDDIAGGRLSAEYLLALSRRRIAHITGRFRHQTAVDRFEGVRAAVEEAGAELVGGRALFGDWSEEWGRQAIGLALAADPTLDAVSCGSDQIARGVIEGLRSAGRSVPEDVSVVGYDNWDVMAQGRTPSLTTIDPELPLIGRRAGELLLAAIDGQPLRGTHVMAPHLVVRDSTTVNLRERPNGPAKSPTN